MIKIRLQGTWEEVEELVSLLRQSLEIVEESDEPSPLEPVQFVKRYLTVQKLEAGDRQLQV